MNRERTLKLKLLQKNIAYTFKYLSLLNQALTHKSFVNENPRHDCCDNERLEFLGDAVLNMIISHLLMEAFPHAQEGDLTKLRSTIVNEKSLAVLAHTFKLGEFLLLGKGEEHTMGRSKISILANTYEALIAAVYLDGGYKKVSHMINLHFTEILSGLHQGSITPIDYKSQLQEYTQDIFKTTPHYTVVREHGPDHNKLFEVSITINHKVWGKGIGKNKKDAAQKAAQEALEKLTKLQLLDK